MSHAGIRGTQAGPVAEKFLNALNLISTILAQWLAIAMNIPAEETTKTRSISRA
jgi:hypothetical protein